MMVTAGACYLAVVLLLAAGSLTQMAWADFRNFITANPDDHTRPMDGGREFRFVSLNDVQLPFNEQEQRWATPFEVEDGIRTIAQMGGQVVRIRGVSVGRSSDRHAMVILDPDKPIAYREEAFVALDYVIHVAHRCHVRLIMPFFSPWYPSDESLDDGMGRFEDYRHLERGRGHFFTDPGIRQDLKTVITHILNRANTRRNGVKYKDDEAIMCWETANEPPGDAWSVISMEQLTDWTRDIARHLKTEDPKHLVMDGYLGGSASINAAILDEPSVDIVSNHYYFPGYGTEIPDFAAQCRTDKQAASNNPDPSKRKAFLVGEFALGELNKPGYGTVQQLRDFLTEVADHGALGALGWQLGHHMESGGFYQNGWAGIHWPGFPEGQDYDETAKMSLLREFAYSIRNETPSPLPTLDPPAMLQPTSVYAINWQGSTGARSYDIERATTPDDSRADWAPLQEGRNLSDAGNLPLFQDWTAVPGQDYYYRVRAIKDGQESGWSHRNTSPVRVPSLAAGIHEENAAEIATHGAWARWASAEYRDGQALFSNQKGSRLRFWFRGANARILGSRGPSGALMEVSVDGGPLLTIRNHADQDQHQQVIYDTGLLAPGYHSVTLIVRGECDPPSENPECWFISVDSIEISAGVAIP